MTNAIGRLPEQVDEILQLDNQIRDLAERFYGADCVLFVGRGYDFPTALQGALKLKEISYLHAEGYAAGGLKHGPLAQVNPRTPTVALATPSRTCTKTLSNLQEISARGGPIIAVADQHDTQAELVADHVIRIPSTIDCLQPILNVIPLQLLTYHIAVLRGCDVDRPRNLAKSVTVEWQKLPNPFG
ncbi:MAG TPA: SIS domain-containing protein [Planctomycetes bacterium]|nr:SIS domain-containing protein [Fuerstiella sp.]HIK93639.1 SIS domain-containing protein [Planctomycetota bacterium]